MAAIHEVLLKVVGDVDQAEDALEKVAVELEAFGQIHAEAEATLETHEAESRIDRLQDQLEILSLTTATPEIKTDVAGVIAQIQAVRAELAALPDDTVVDVEVRKDLTDRLRSLSRQAMALQRAADKASGTAKSFFARITDSAVSLGPFTTQLKTAAPILAGLSSVIVSLGGALVAMAASLAAAIGGVIALGTALAGVFGVGLVAGLIAMARFKDTMNEAGTPAHDLLKAFEELKGVISTLGKVFDPVFTALAQTLRLVGPLLKSLGPSFGQFGRGIAAALTPLNHLLTDPAFIQTIRELIQLSGKALRPLAQIGTELFRIFIDVARAAMPFLIDILKDIAGFLKGLDTGNLGAMTGLIGVLVRNFKLWWDLLVAVGDVILQIFKGALGPGEDFVGFLTDGVKAMADFLGSAEGQKQIAQFFEDTLPLAKEVVEFIAKLVLAFIQLGQIAAPIVKPIVESFNLVLDVINFLLDAFSELPGPIRQVIAIAVALLLPFTKVRAIIAILIAVFGDLKGVATSVFNAIKGAASSVASKISSAWHKLLDFLKGAFKILVVVYKAIWDKIKGIVISAATKVRNFVVGAWNFIKEKTSAVFHGVLRIVGSVFRTIRDFIGGIVGKISHAIGDAWQFVKDKTVGAFNAVWNFIKNTFRKIWEFIKSVPGRFLQLGKDIVQGIADGIREGKDWVVDAVKDAVLAPVNFIGDKLGIDSPSKVAHEWGAAIGQGLVNGMNRMARDVGKASNRMAVQAVGGRRGLAGAGKLGGAGGGGGGGNTFNIPVTVPGGGSPDPDAWAAAIDRRLRQKGLSIA